jgi:hypothetical protein
MGFIGSVTVATFLFLILTCRPPSLFWNLEAQQVYPEKCLSQSAQQTFFNFNGIYNIVQDFSIYLLPIPMLWNLQMALRQKIALGVLLSIGLVAVAGKHLTLLSILRNLT